MSQETKTLPIMKAVNDAINAVRKQHAGIPEVAVVVGYTGKGKVHGHFAPKSWETKEGAELHELFLSGESLARGGRATFGTIVHELAHAYAEENGIKETSNVGRYHNKKFKELAEKFGLKITQAPTIGWSVTEVPDDTAARYAGVIAKLEEALVIYRRGFKPQPEDEAGEETKQAKWQMVCEECSDPVAIGKKWFDLNQPVCSCGEPYILFKG